VVRVSVSRLEVDKEEGSEDENYSCDRTCKLAPVYLLCKEYSPIIAPMLTPPPPPSARVASLTAVLSFSPSFGAPLEVDSYACAVTDLTLIRQRRTM